MFAKNNRLAKKRDVNRVMRKGSRGSSSFVFCSSLPNSSGVSRFTVVVGLKSGLKAAGRNLLKRRCRSVIGENYKNIFGDKNYDVVIGFRGSFDKVPKYSQVKENTVSCLKQVSNTKK